MGLHNYQTLHDLPEELEGIWADGLEAFEIVVAEDIILLNKLY